ncbi:MULTISPECIES: hypothetical protein [Streptomyces]|nr:MULTISPECIES: hypothetical protein [Streptomyces]
MDRVKSLIAAFGAALAASVGVAHPELLPAATLAVAVWVALALFLEL